MLTLRLIQSNGVSVASASASRLSPRASHFNPEMFETRANELQKRTDNAIRSLYLRAVGEKAGRLVYKAARS